MATREGTFYAPWPNIDGKPLQLQWGEIRSNQAELKAISRNSQQELEDGVDELNALRALLGQAYGDLDFRNKYRLMYDKTTKEFCLQKNDGTVANPIWTDVWCIRFHDGQFQVVSNGGIVSSAGFYNFPREIHIVADSRDLGTDTDEDVTILNTDRIFFDRLSGLKVRQIDCGAHKGAPEVTFTAPFGRSQIFNASGEEWVINHNFGAGPQMVQVMDSDDRVIIPDTVDVSDPNTAYFYFHASVVGKAIIATGGLGAAELKPKDPFYLVVRTENQSAATRTLQPNAELIFDKRYFYVEAKEDVALCRTRPHAYVSFIPNFYLDQLLDVTTGPLHNVTPGHVLTWQPQQNAFVPRPSQAGALYLNDLKDVNAPSATGGSVISYNSTTGLWEVTDPIRSGYIHTQAAANVEWQVAHGQNSTLVIAQVYDNEYRQIFPDVQDVSDPNTAYFYFTEAIAGRAFIIPTGPAALAGDHGALSGLLDDDHTQYLLIDGTRAMTGNLKVVDGLVSSPGIQLAGDPNTGIYNDGTADRLNIAAGGSQAAMFRNDAGSLQLLVTDGSGSRPSIGFINDVNTGFVRDAATGSIDVYDSGVRVARLNSSSVTVDTHTRFDDTVDVENKVTAEAFYVRSGGELGIKGLITDNISADHIRAGGFYFKPGPLGVDGGGDLARDFITFQIETLARKNYFMDGDAPFKYIIDKITMRSESGFGNATFYINPGAVPNVGRYGSSIQGLQDFYIAPITRTYTPNSPVVVNEGDEWFMGVFGSTPTARDVVGTVHLRRQG